MFLFHFAQNPLEFLFKDLLRAFRACSEWALGLWQKVFPAVLAHVVAQHASLKVVWARAMFYEDIWIQFSLLIRLAASRLMVFIISTRKEPHCLKIRLCGHVVYSADTKESIFNRIFRHNTGRLIWWYEMSSLHPLSPCIRKQALDFFFTPVLDWKTFLAIYHLIT